MTSLAHKRILLVGAPASGKSSVAAHLKVAVGDCEHFDLDTEIHDLCAKRHLNGPLADIVIDEAVQHLLDRISTNCTIVELAHHDYITLYSSGALRLDDFDCIVILSADFALLRQREEAREHDVPLSYIARCFGSVEALCCVLPTLRVPWLRFNTNAIKPEHICQCIIDFLRHKESSSLRQLVIVPTPDRGYLGGNLQVGVEWDDRVVQMLMERAAIHTALDVGCGNGESIRKFSAFGISAWGVEGAPIFNDCGHRIFEVDFTKQWVEWPTKPDLVWCIEVLEHIPSRYEDNIVRTIALNAGKLAFVTAAAPGQPGYHHVNCQPQSYWINRFHDAGLRYIPQTPQLLSQLSDKGPFGMNVFKTNGMLFEVTQ